MRESKRFPTRKRFLSELAAETTATMTFCVYWSASSPLKLISKSRYALRTEREGGRNGGHIKRQSDRGGVMEKEGDRVQDQWERRKEAVLDRK